MFDQHVTLHRAHFGNPRYRCACDLGAWQKGVTLVRDGGEGIVVVTVVIIIIVAIVLFLATILNTLLLFIVRSSVLRVLSKGLEVEL